MAQFRFNCLSQGLKQTSAGLFSVSLANTPSGTPKYVYKPVLTPAAVPSVQTASASGYGAASLLPDKFPEPIIINGVEYYNGQRVPKKMRGWQEWKTWKDVPDDRIATSFWRDPNNTVYAHPRYIKLRKKSLFLQRPPVLFNEIPVYLGLHGKRDLWMVRAIWAFTIAVSLYCMYEYYLMIYKKYYPDSNLFYFF